MALAILLALAVLGALLWGAWVFNRLIGLRNRMRAAWGDIDALLKRRSDLIPNLVEAVRGYATYEQRTLENVTAARTTASLAGGAPEATAVRAEAESVLGRRIQQLIAVAEAYPELRASASFLELQRSLVETEDDIAHGRRYFNAVVRDYNTRRETFPDLLVARGLGFEPGEFFELPEPAQREAPDVGGDAA